MIVLGRLGRSGPLIVLFIWELLVSAVQVAILTLTPNLNKRMRPEFISYPLTVVTDAEITLLANLITLTPGTLSVGVAADRKTLLIHALNAPDVDAVIGQIAAGFEAKVLEVFR